MHLSDLNTPALRINLDIAALGETPGELFAVGAFQHGDHIERIDMQRGEPPGPEVDAAADRQMNYQG